MGAHQRVQATRNSSRLTLDVGREKTMNELTIALFGLIGVLVSALVALLVSRTQVRSELTRTRIESQTQFLGKLYDRRLEVYPRLYEALGVLGGRILGGAASVDDVTQTWNIIREWDKQNALFLSAYSTKTMISLRRLLIRFSSLSPGDFSKTKQKKELLPALIDMQMVLKTELGVLHADGFHSPVETMTLRDAVRRATIETDE